MAVARPIKEGGFDTYVEEYDAGFKKIHAAELDGDLNTIFGAVNALPAGPQGPPGPSGPAGPAGPPPDPSTIAFRYVQTSAATVWTITHGLPFRPNVSAVDSTGREIIPGAIDYPSGTTVQLTFSAAVGGEAYLS